MKKGLAFLLLLALLNQLLFPITAFALTGGPSQPETAGFQQIDATDMVDLFSGDFKYNIPLLEVGGYPVNLTYNAGIGMDQEASWVGLGWNLNCGVVTRAVRGIPDDFKGEEIIEERYMKENKTYGVGGKTILELLGKLKLPGGKKLSVPLGFSIYHNNYNGMGYTLGKSFEKQFGPLSLKLSLGYNSQTGLDVEPTMGLAFLAGKETSKTSNPFSVGASAGMNSRSGLKSLQLTGATASPKPLSVGVGLPVNTNSFTPGTALRLKSTSINFKATVGGELFGGHPGFGIDGQYSSQSVLTETQASKAYGYVFTEHANANSLLDLNREKDGAFSEDMKNLPVTNFTYDVFSIQGQGLAGTVRAHRNDVGQLSDPFLQTNGVANADVGLELGLGNAFRAGGDATITVSNVRSGKWEPQEFNMVPNTFKHKGIGNFYENCYFKFEGEQNVTDSLFFKNVGSFSPVNVELIGSSAVPVLRSNDSYVGTLPQTATSTYFREPRSKTVFFLSAEEAEVAGMLKTRPSYPDNYFTDTTNSVASIALYGTDEDDAKRHQIAEINCLDESGTHYNYALPAWNKLQKDVTFNASNFSTSGGMVAYSLSGNKPDHKRGLDHFYQATKTPAYAHSYFLTSILSPDYEDINGDGVTDDDLGNFTKFNYTRKSETYKWRAPYENLKARLSEGHLIDKTDDKGSYSYGVKELWYLHTIESKDQIAEFYISPRYDGVGVAGEHGGLPGSVTDADRQWKLDSIVLYNKADRVVNKLNAIRLKKIEFVYSYHLCKNIPNFDPDEDDVDPGKLTLESVYIYYGNSNKGKLSPYTFTYSNTNPGYDQNKYDRWGNYKEASNWATNMEFPYVNQQNTNADTWASAWNLETIKLPSGGIIEVAYEADRYAFVQNKRAMEMFRIAGFGSSSALLPSTALFSPKTVSNAYMYVRLADSPLGITNATFRKRYLEGMKNLYFSAEIRVADVNNGNSGYERITGYAEIDINQSGMCADTRYAYIKLQTVSRKNRDYNPLTVSSLLYAENSLTQFIYPGSNPNQSGLENIMQSILGLVGEIVSLFKDSFKIHTDKGRGRDVKLEKSWIRLNSPTLDKLGGGSRVASVKMYDNWAEMVELGETAEYGQQFSYEMEDPVYGTISSGVASYEPMIGGDENPWRQPSKYTTRDNWMKPRGEYFQEEPFGEMFFPSASIGYRQVRVADIHEETARSGKGYTMHAFFTAYDYPTRLAHTQVKMVPQNSSVSVGKVGDSYQRMTASQGYVIVTNDMHGKPKSTITYGKSDAGADVVTSGTRYHYGEESPGKLNSEAKTIWVDYDVPEEKERIKIDNTVFGIDVDMTLDSRYHENKNITTKGSFNFDFSMASVFPVFFLKLFENVSVSETTFKSMVVTKVISQTGILVRTETFDHASSIASDRIIRDAYTGADIVTSVENEFRDKQYAVNIPAAYAHSVQVNTLPVFRPAYNRVNFTDHVTYMPTSSNLWWTAPSHYYSINPMWCPGDKLLLRNLSTNALSVAWISYANVTGSCEKARYMYLKDAGGNAIPAGDYEMKNITTHASNQINQTSYSFTSTDNPVLTGSSLWLLSGNVLSAEGKSVGYQLKKFTTQPISPLFTSLDAYIPFLSMQSKFSFRGTRGYAGHARVDGTLSSFAHLFGFTSSWSKTICPGVSEYDGIVAQYPLIDILTLTNWKVDQAIQKVSIAGNLVEYDDVLGVPYTSLFGYKERLVTATARNSRQHLIASEGFEEFLMPYYAGYVPQFSLGFIKQFGFTSSKGRKYFIKNNQAPSSKGSVSADQAHTGRYSMKVNANKVLTDSVDLTGINLIDIGYVIYPFAPKTGGNSIDMVVSGWIREDQATNFNGGYANASVRVRTKGESTSVIPYQLKAAGPMVERWQRFEGTITIPAVSEYFVIELDGGTVGAYFDDLRIYPVDAQMVSYVFDPFSDRMMAVLDENNYATLFEYDETGALVRKKKETERGIMTLMEHRKAVRKQ